MSPPYIPIDLPRAGFHTLPLKPMATDETGGHKPFFRILTETGVATMFLKAVQADTEAARAYLCRRGLVDLYALRDILDEAAPLPEPIPLVMAAGRFTHFCRFHQSIRCATRSVMLPACILHLHMVADAQGTWKIAAVEKE